MLDSIFQELAKRYKDWKTKDLLREIDRFRAEKKYKESDELREFFDELGYRVLNTKNGSIVIRK